MELVREHHSPFVLDTPSRCPWFSDLGPLAVRDDLADWTPEARKHLTELVAELRATGCPHHRADSSFEDHRWWGLWPWLARFHPARLVDECCDLLKGALCSKQPWYVLRHLCPLVPGGDETSRRTMIQQLLESLPALAMNLGEPCESGRPLASFDLSHLSDTVLLWGSPDQACAWLMWLSETHERRKAADLLTTCQLLSHLERPELAELSRAQVMEHYDAKEDEVERCELLAYWGWLWACSAGRDATWCDWAIDHYIRAFAAHNHCRWPVALIVRSAPESALAAILANPEVAAKMTDTDWRLLWLYGREGQMAVPAKADTSQLSGAIPMDIIGYLLHNGRQQEAFSAWGRDLLAVVLEVVQHPSMGATANSVPTRISLDESGRIHYLKPIMPPPPSLRGGTPTNVWGIDLNRPGAAEAFVTGAWEKEAEEALTKWQAEQAEEQPWNGFRLSEFSAIGALRTWATEHREEFLAFAGEFLKHARRGEIVLPHLGPFYGALLEALLSLDVDMAIGAYEWARQVPLFPLTNTHYGIRTFVRSMIGHAGSDDRRWHWIVGQCATDEDLALIAVAAHEMEAEDALQAFLQGQLLASPLSKDRLMAVSVLAGCGDNWSITFLRQLASDDPSRAVRRHAQWALEVSQSEYCCRAMYSRILTERAPESVMVMLQQMQPALLPSAEVWRRELERLAPPAPGEDRRLRAMVELFWDHRGCTSSTGGPEAYGRALRAYYCGTKTESGVHDRMAPWWRI
jgi:hypothetical protein